MKLKFEEAKDFPETYIVSEDGVDTDTKTYERIGVMMSIDDREPTIVLDDDYSGILAKDEIKQILDFMESEYEK